MVPGPETFQVTAVLPRPVTLAENCSVDPAVMLALVGEMLMVAALRLILQDACAEESIALVAVTVAVVVLPKVEGAV
jgi:hypothetical protein